MKDWKIEIDYHSPYDVQEEAWEHGFIWRGVDEIFIELGSDHWYGGGGLLHQQWPLEKIAMYPAPFITSDNGRTGLLGILHPFWWNSKGGGVLVEGDEVEVGFNAPLHGEPPDHSFSAAAPFDIRPQLAAGIETTQQLCIKGKNLTLRFFECNDPRQVVEAYWKLLKIAPPPADYVIEKPLWTTWAHFKNHISHDKVLDFARQMVEHGFSCSILGIDAKWQDEFGNTRFDLEKFPNPAQTIAALHERGLHVTLWCVPFFMETSAHFKPALELGYVIKNLDGTPYIGTWWEGKAAFLDVTNPDAMRWHLDNLERLAKEINLDGFKFDAGEAMFYDIPNTVRHHSGAPNYATRHYIENAAQRFAWSDSRSAWFSQSQPMLFRQWDKATQWGHDNGLASVITQAMTIHLLGYPYSFPDMIGGNQYGEDKPTDELLIRWTQAVAPMPIIQFSIPPWEQGEACTTICARYAQLHGDLAGLNKLLARQQVPIVRPIWWLAPQDEAALVCDDEYLIGEELLVAPVMKEGARQRDLYLPPGTWASYWDDSEQHIGGQWLRDYPAPLDVLPLFVRVS